MCSPVDPETDIMHIPHWEDVEWHESIGLVFASLVLELVPESLLTAPEQAMIWNGKGQQSKSIQVENEGYWW